MDLNGTLGNQSAGVRRALDAISGTAITLPLVVFAASPRNASPNCANLALFCAVLPIFANVSLGVWMNGKAPPLAAPVPASKKKAAGYPALVHEA